MCWVSSWTINWNNPEAIKDQTLVLVDTTLFLKVSLWSALGVICEGRSPVPGVGLGMGMWSASG